MKKLVCVVVVLVGIFCAATAFSSLSPVYFRWKIGSTYYYSSDIRSVGAASCAWSQPNCAVYANCTDYNDLEDVTEIYVKANYTTSENLTGTHDGHYYQPDGAYHGWYDAYIEEAYDMGSYLQHRIYEGAFEGEDPVTYWSCGIARGMLEYSTRGGYVKQSYELYNGDADICD